MIIRSHSASIVAIGMVLTAMAAPAQARPGVMGPGMGWHDPFGDSYPSSQRLRSADRVEGRVEVTRFVAEDGGADLLGKGSAISVPAPTGAGVEDAALRPFAAAVDDRLAAVGYQTATNAGGAGQLVELRVSRDVVVPEEGPKKPVSGEMAVGVSNHGSMMGLGLNIDLSKPKKALVSTRLEARIRDAASGKVLWEGRADMVSREGSTKWSESAVAARLATALFDKFPGKPGETSLTVR
ncbi:DUF4136 domain-containing protein [Novosphingobium sp. TH158]|uniref:DUF4136 domain-containing protein n=1 Tax=Novosphingobium sp. TH158 TaxID=2067455 RepID=UPI000C7D6396|nr:DUF4136 domain-containing protein [Novosphingobium sp. TH158]PLK26869.1 hypothetical protein C0V78_08180 [Novosphingobium sp. TH158]